MLVFLVGKPAFALQDGLTPATAWTNISFVYNSTRAGNHYFNIDGVTFVTTVLSNHYILLLRYNAPNGSPLARMDDFTAAGSNQALLPNNVLAKFTNLDHVRLLIDRVADSADHVDVTTSNPAILARVAAGETLHAGLNDNAINNDWTGINSQYLTADATCNSGAVNDMAVDIFHVCGNATLGTHLIPGSNYRRAYYGGGNVDANALVRLWVKPNPLPGSMTVTKTADKTVNVPVGDTVTYTYTITNTSLATISNVTLNDVHDGYGSPPVPDIETATVTDSTTVDSGDTYNNVTGDNNWDRLGPGDSLTVTATYVVTQDDFNFHQ